MVIIYIPSYTNLHGNGMYPCFHQLATALDIPLSGEAGEILGEVCILDNFNMVLEAALNN